MAFKITFSRKDLKRTLSRFGIRLVLFSGSPLVRKVVYAFFAVLLVWLLFGRVWRPLQVDVPLPLGVEAQNPSLNTKLLDEINDERNNRVNYERSSFNEVYPIFIGTVPDS